MLKWFWCKWIIADGTPDLVAFGELHGSVLGAVATSPVIVVGVVPVDLTVAIFVDIKFRDGVDAIRRRSALSQRHGLL